MEKENSENFCLRWNNHQSNMIQFFDELRKTKDFTDVSLIADTHEIIRCHKIVLAAGSLYFERIFHLTEPEQQTVVLTNTNFAVLESLIMFMYRGEIHVHQDDLKPLLKAAMKFEIKGLKNFEDKNLITNGRRNDIPSPYLDRSSTPSTTPHSKMEHNGHLPSSMSHTDLYNFHTTNLGVSSISSQGIWPIPAFPFSQHPYHAHYSALSRSYMHSADTSPLTKKKIISSASMANVNTPILRTALVGQGSVEKANSTSGSNIENVENGSGSNGSGNDNDRRYSTDFSVNEDTSSPHTDMEDDERRLSPGSRRNSFASNNNKEWKRYKQYSREDINAAIDVVKAGEMSALKASRKFNVPSRTLYDKVKKLGIKKQRHSGRHSNRSVNSIDHRIRNDSARFPYGVGGNSDGNIYPKVYGMVDPTEMLMNLKHRSPSPEPEPLPNNDNLENLVEDLSIKSRQDISAIHPLIPKKELNEETPTVNENYNS